MYVEAICPLCFASHVVPEELRGSKYRCEECEELFIVSKKAKRTSKKPPRPREVQPADDLAEDAEVVDVAEVLPEAKLTDRSARKKPRNDEVLDIPDDAVQSGGARGKSPPAVKRSREDEEEARPRRRRREDDEEDVRPRRARHAVPACRWPWWSASWREASCCWAVS